MYTVTTIKHRINYLKKEKKNDITIGITSTFHS